MRKFVLAAAAAAAAVVVLVGITLPPARLALPAVSDGTIPGILHVHTTRSDGAGTPEQIAAAAARAGLGFIVFADHGDGTRPPDPPVYRSGVLCLDGVEISTTGGHYVAVGMPQAPYPLAGDPRDVVDDVRRLGGFGIVAHPDSPKPSLHWRDWSAPFDAMEWLNPDTSWRQYSLTPGWRPKVSLAAALLQYPIRPTETIGRLLGAPGELPRFDVMTRARRIVALAGVDAHAKLALRTSEPGDNRFALPIPGYEATFRTLSVHVATEHPLTRDAEQDAAMLLRALRAGHAYTAIDAFATPPSFAFSAANDLGTVHEGDELGASGPVTLTVTSNAPTGFTTVIYRNGEILTSSRERTVSIQASATPAVYRAEIRTSSAADARRWIVGNPIYVRAPGTAPTAPAHPPATTLQPLLVRGDDDGWRIEKADGDAALDRPATLDGNELRLRYGLDAGPASRQFVALAANTPNGLAAYDRLTFTIRAEHPMRVSIQLRVPEEGGAGERWQRSVFVGSFDQERTVYFDDLTPVGEAASPKPPLARVRTILFVIDTTNAKPGSSGRLWIRNAALAR